jgi:hypothetical protein
LETSFIAHYEHYFLAIVRNLLFLLKLMLAHIGIGKKRLAGLFIDLSPLGNFFQRSKTTQANIMLIQTTVSDAR